MFDLVTIILLLVLAAPALIMVAAAGSDLFRNIGDAKTGRCRYCGFAPCQRNCRITPLP